MKIFKMILGCWLALIVVTSADAQNHVYLRIAGSTAFRKAVYYAIARTLNGGFVFAYTIWRSDYGVLEANQAIFTGTALIDKRYIPVIIKTDFSGSVGGIATLAANLTVGPGGSAYGGGGWLVDSTGQNYGTNFPSGGTAVPADFNGQYPLAFFDAPVTADVILSDCFQSSAPATFRTPLLTDTIVGVVPFVFVLTPGATAHGIVNTSSSITAEQVRDILVEGGIKLSELSGNGLDSEPVLAVGFDEDGGERVQALTCSGIPIGTFLRQYQPLSNGSTQPTIVPQPYLPGWQITGAALWPAVTVDGISYPKGDSGYAFDRSFFYNQIQRGVTNYISQGGFFDALNLSHSGPSFPTYAPWFISCVGIDDLVKLANATELCFKGVPYSAANVEGFGATGFIKEYELWGYEHLMYRTTLSGDAKNVADQIAYYLTNLDAGLSGIFLSEMHVHRNTDGGPIKPGGTPPK